VFDRGIQSRETEIPKQMRRKRNIYRVHKKKYIKAKMQRSRPKNININNRNKRLSFWNKLFVCGVFVGFLSLGLGIYSHFTGSISQKKIMNMIEHTDEIYSPYLLQKYPLGYVLFAIQSGEENITFTKDRLSKEFIINWNTAEVFKITNDKIILRCPDIKFIDSDNTFVGVQLGFPRKIGIPYTIIRGDINVMGELLVDGDENFICVLGFRRNTQG
jgi:hypothetical protein